MDRQLVKKLAEVMQQVKYIQKTGYNSFHKYKYATEADVNEKVREELAQRNVVMIPNMKSHSIRTHTTSKGNTEYIVTVEVEFNFMDGDTGETIAFTVFGEGQDAGDKATYKGITGAQKYALMKAFMIPTGDDPEADNGVDERNHAYAPPKNEHQRQDEDLAAIEKASRDNVSQIDLASEGQVKMLIAKAAAAGFKPKDKESLMKSVSELIGKTIASFNDVGKKDVTTVAKWLDEAKSA